MGVFDKDPETLAREETAYLKQRLLENIDNLIPAIFPKAKRKGRAWNIGGLDGAPGSSMFIYRDKGNWGDQATLENGNLWKLIEITQNCRDFRDAKDWARAWLREPARAKLAERKAEAVADDAPTTPEDAQALWKTGRPIEGTASAIYLAGRGVPDAYRVKHHDDATPKGKRRQQATLVPYQLIDGTLACVQRILITPDGKRARKDNKLSIGPASGTMAKHNAAVGFTRVLMEGPSDGMAGAAMFPELPVYSAPGTGHLAKAPILADSEILYILMHNDKKNGGLIAAEKLMLQYDLYAPHVTIIALYPPGELNDWDDARNHPDYGTAACRALLGLK
ncbi:hypothetical protein [Elstera sp.]|jgi:hypothetical protein|uniref:DUF7146 domain-containing protein n=1 Tax=Elstera sp. TaxID=1916664 RepID=UPI0037BEF039